MDEKSEILKACDKIIFKCDELKFQTPDASQKGFDGCKSKEDDAPSQAGNLSSKTLTSDSAESLKPISPNEFQIPDTSQKELMFGGCKSKNDNASSQAGNLSYMTLTTDSAESLKQLNATESPNKLKLPDSDKDENAHSLSQYSNASNFPRTEGADNRATEFMMLLEKHKTALRELSNPDLSKLQNQVISNSSKPQNYSLQNKTPASNKTKVSNLKTLISNKETRDIGLFYSLLSKQEVGSFQSTESNTTKKQRESSKTKEKSKSSESDKKSKSSEVNKESKSSRKTKQSDSRKCKTRDSNKISKSSALRKTKLFDDLDSTESPIISDLLKSLQEIELSEASGSSSNNDKSVPNSAQFEKKKLISDSENEIENYFSLFKQNKTDSSPAESSDSGTLTPGSDDTESKTSSEPAGSLERSTNSYGKSKLYKFSAKSNFPETSTKFNLSKTSAELSVRPKLPRQSSKSNFLESPVKSDIANESPRSGLPDQSVRPKLPRQSSKSNFLESSVKSDIATGSPRSGLPDQSVRPKLPRHSRKSNVPDSHMKVGKSTEYARSESSYQSVQQKLPKPTIKLNIPHLHARESESDQKFGIVWSNLTDQSMKSKQSDRSGKSKIPFNLINLNLPDSSMKLKSTDLTMRSENIDPSARSNLPKPSLSLPMSDQSEVILEDNQKSKLAESSEEVMEGAVADVLRTNTSSLRYPMDLELSNYVISRRPFFMRLQRRAKHVKAYMEVVASLKENHQHIKIANTRQQKYDASEWIKLLYFWDLVIEELNMIIEMTDMLYDSEGNVQFNSEEFHEFMENLLSVFRDILDLICACQNGLTRYKIFCSSHEIFLFLNHAITFQARISSVLKKIRIESEQFTAFKKLS